MNDGCKLMSVSGPLRGAAVCERGCKLMSVSGPLRGAAVCERRCVS